MDQVHPHCGHRFVIGLIGAKKIPIIRTAILYSPAQRVIRWNPKSALRTTKGGTQSPALGLGHEADHAVQHLTNPRQFKKDSKPTDPKYDTPEERRVIQGSETSDANRLGEGVRNDHAGKEYRVPDSDKR